MQFSRRLDLTEQACYLPSYDCVTTSPRGARQEILRVLRVLRG
jgi:hypothetical protein